MGRHGRRGRARLSRHRRRLTCHFFSRVRDLRIPTMTCANVGLTLSGAADTFRIAPSDRQVGRRDRTKRRPRKDGGDTGWKGRCGGLWKGREAARSLSREGSPRRGGSRDPIRYPMGHREMSHRRSATCGRGPAARSDREPRDGRGAARPTDRTAEVAKVARTPRGACTSSSRSVCWTTSPGRAADSEAAGQLSVVGCQ